MTDNVKINPWDFKPVTKAEVVEFLKSMTEDQKRDLAVRFLSESREPEDTEWKIAELAYLFSFSDDNDPIDEALQTALSPLVIDPQITLNRFMRMAGFRK